MKIRVINPTQQDYEKFQQTMGSAAVLDGRFKLICTDDEGHVGELFMERDRFERLGLVYIEEHAKLEYSELCEEWFVHMSENDWQNDQKHHPDKIIRVEFVGVEDGTGREIYKGIESGRYYLRGVSSREPFAKWLVCGARRMPDDGDEPRPNLIFQLGDQQERVVYDDWNGVAAYEEQFNKNFRVGGQ